MIKKHPFRLVALIVLLVSTSFAQPAAAPHSQADRIALYQSLLDLTNPWTVMCIAAHPDDEDGTSLVVMRRKYGAHTVSLFSTFGEGGQNAIGPELYEELGAIRVRETMAASEIQGSEPHFLGLKDFGFSKSLDETFKEWGHDEALRRMVLQIRKLRPDVIITNHSTTSNDHGHHQATARLVVEAFDASADSKRFPEQLKDDVTTWQVQRLFVRLRGSQTLADNPVIVTIDPNEQDPVRGVSFAEQALSGLQKHATQGPWPKSVAQMAARFANQSDGRLPVIRYRLAREAKGAEAIPKEPVNFLDGLQLAPDLAKRLEPPTIDGRPLIELVDQRERILDTLTNAARREVFGRSILDGLVDVSAEPRQARMISRLNEALAAASGVSAKLTQVDQLLVQRQSGSFDVEVTNRGSDEVRVTLPIGREVEKDYVRLSGSGGSGVLVSAGKTIKVHATYVMPSETDPTIPHADHLYDKGFRGVPVVAPLFVWSKGLKFPIVAGEYLDVARPFEITDISPSPMVMISPRVGASSAGVDILPTKPPQVTVKLANHLNRSFKGEVAFGFENRSPETRVRIDLLPKQTTTLAVAIPNTDENRAAHLRRPELANSLWFALRNAGMHENLIKSSVPVVWLDARVARKAKVGYVRGFDFSLPNALNALAVESKELSVEEVKTADLSKYSSIIVDNRVYESQPELIAANQKLLDFANAGGTLIVFYHKSDEWNPDPRRNRPQLAPYKLIVGNERVTDENAPISFLEPDHALLNSPNKMGQEDFVGWIQERGVNYPREWDAEFHALLQSNDPGEAPLKGGLLVADYGKGRYIYSSMVWYRQLRAGVPGAYRMLANMISYGQGR